MESQTNLEPNTKLIFGTITIILVGGILLGILSDSGII